MTVLVAGEALIDVIVRGERRIRRPGGSPLNVAVALGRLGLDVEFVTSIGDDPDGALIQNHLSDAGVRRRGRLAERTSTATAHLAADGAADYVFDLTWNVDEFDTRSFQAFHAGSLGVLLEPGGSVVRKAITAAVAPIVSVDPNVRPSLVGNRAQCVSNFEDAVRSTDIVKLSDEDAAWLYPDLEPIAALRRLQLMGPVLVVLTRGATSTLASFEGHEFEIPTHPAARVVDTVGAGDTFMGALLHDVLRQGLTKATLSGARVEDIIRAVHFGNRAASYVVGREGADPPWLGDLA